MKKELDKFKDYLKPSIMLITIISIFFGFFINWLSRTNGYYKLLGIVILFLLFLIWGLLTYIHNLHEKNTFDFQMDPLSIKLEEDTGKIVVIVKSGIHLEIGTLVVMIYQDSQDNSEKEIGVFVTHQQLSEKDQYSLEHYYSDNISPYIEKLLVNNHNFLKRIKLKHLVNQRVLENIKYGEEKQ